MQRLNEIHIQRAGIIALNYEDVADKLGLTADQQEKLKELGEESRRKSADSFSAYNAQSLDNLKRQELTRKQNEITSERKDKSIALLTDDQKAKFEKLQGKKFDTSTIKVTGESFNSGAQFNARGALPKN